MRMIGDAADEFKSCYRLLPLDSLSACFFRRNSAGDSKLRALAEKFSGDVMIEFLKFESAIEVYSLTTPELLEQGVQAVDQLLNSFGQSAANASRNCVFCHQPTYHTFVVCGHHYCKECLFSYSQAQASSGSLPLTCPKCNTDISILDIKSSLSPEELGALAMQVVRAMIKATPNYPLALCKRAECGGLMNRNAGYSACPTCGVAQCPECMVEEDSRHAGNTCREHRRLVRAEGQLQLDALLQKAKDFVKAEWKSGQILRIEENPGLKNGCPAMHRFCAGLQQKGGLAALQSHFFAWHGTSEPSVPPICHHGFDPNKRSGQACGPGEYFGYNSQVSHGYCRGGSKMLVALLLRVEELTTRENFCYVVNNPKDWSVAYCVPFLVISFGTDTGTTPFISSAPVPLPFNMASLNDDDDDDDDDEDGSVKIEGQKATSLMRYTYSMPFRWHWMADSGKFEPYNDAINSLLETSYTYFKSGNAHGVFTTPPIVRYIDDLPQSYQIDFIANTQTNLKTGYVRKIRRDALDVAHNEDITWEVHASDWRPLETLVQQSVEKSFRAYIDGRGPGVVQTQYPGRPEFYSLDFINGTQTNLLSKTTRAIRRNVTSEISASTVVFSLPAAAASNLSILASKDNLSNLNNKLCKIVQRAAGENCKWSVPSVHVDVQQRTVTLAVRGVAATIAGILAGEIQANIHKCLRSTSIRLQLNGPGVSSTLSNPRLMTLTSSLSPLLGRTRNDAMLFLAHTMVWVVGCSIYGGFVRDWVIRGESANDIDTLLCRSGEPEVERVKDLLLRTISMHPIELVSSRRKGAAYCLQFSGPWSGEPIDIHLIDPNLPRPPPKVDCDAGNLCITRNGLGKKEERAGGNQLPLIKCVEHCLKKKFVFFYNIPDQHQMAMPRLKMYFSRGWKCLSTIPEPYASSNELQTYKSLQTPMNKYKDVQWWV